MVYITVYQHGKCFIFFIIIIAQHSAFEFKERWENFRVGIVLCQHSS